MRHPLLPAGLLGVLAIVVGFSVQLPLKDHNYVPPPHFSKKMLALEFMPDSMALNRFFGATDSETTANVEAMRSALQRDNFFAFSYTFFLVAFLVGCRAATKRAWYWLLVPLAILVGLADLLENAQTLRMLDDLHNEAVQMMLTRLHFWVWIKSLGMAVLLLGAANFLRSAGRIGQVLALLATLAAILGFLSAVWIGLFETYSLLGLSLFFPLLVLFCLFYRK